MKRNLRRAAVYGVAGLATAAIGVSTANALAESSTDGPDAQAAQAPAPVQAKTSDVKAGGDEGKALAPKALVAPAPPQRPAPPVRHVEPAAAHRHATVPAARPVLPKPAKARAAQPHVSWARQELPQKRFVVQAAAQPVIAPAVAPTAVKEKLDTAVKAVTDAHQAVVDAGKALHKAKDQLVQSKKDLEKLRDEVAKPASGKKPCHPALHDLDKKAGFPGELAKHVAKGKHAKTVTTSSSSKGGVVTKTATSTGDGVSSTSTATSTNGTVSANAW